MKLNPALKDFWRTRCDTRVLRGGRTSSKTWDAAGVAIYLAANYRLKFLCMRQFQNKIQESVYAVLVIQIDAMGYTAEFDVQKTAIIHKRTGSSFHFYGIHRNINEIKGFEGADIGWIEEAEGLTKDQWSVIEPTLRKEGAQSWILYNPKFANDFVITNFKHDPENGVIVRHINYDENPFLSETMKRKIERLKESDYEEYEHIYLGVPLADNDKVVIKLSWIMASIDAHTKLGIEPTGLTRVGYDVADDGGDTNATVTAKGMLAISCDEWQGAEDEILKSCSRAYQEAVKYKSLITYDSIGVGASAGGKFNELNQSTFTNEKDYLKHEGFNAAAGVINPNDAYGDSDILNKDFFSNAKAQAWWLIADRFRNTYNAVVKGQSFPENELIAISSEMPNLDKLTNELSTPRRDYDATGKVKVESKKDLSKRKVKSPNLADAFIMAFSQRQMPKLEVFE